MDLKTPHLVAAPGEYGEEVLDGVEPGSRGWGEVEYPAWMSVEPGADLWVFVGGVVVEDGVNDLADGNFALDGVEEADELLMGVLLHAAAEDRAVEDVEGGEECGRAMALVVVGHGPGLARLEGQAWLGSIQRLDLGLLVDGKHHGVSRWMVDACRARRCPRLSRRRQDRWSA